MINDIFMILKEIIKLRVFHSTLFFKNSLATSIIKDLSLQKVKMVTKGNPNTLIILTKDTVVRVPLDELSLNRCERGKNSLIYLNKRKSGLKVPGFIKTVKSNSHMCFFEQRMPGIAIDIPISKIEFLIKKGANALTEFHKETMEQVSGEGVFYNELLNKYINIINPCIDELYRKKLNQIILKVKEYFAEIKLKSVWMHGDYKLENILFNPFGWQLEGVIDWDLYEKDGFPVIDLLYLLIYKSSLIEHKSVVRLLKERYLNLGFNEQEKATLKSYLDVLGLHDAGLKYFIILFWMHHIAERYRSDLIKETFYKKDWIKNNICEAIDCIRGNQ